MKDEKKTKKQPLRGRKPFRKTTIGHEKSYATLEKKLDSHRISTDPFQLIMENLQDIIWITNLDSRIIYVNPTVEKLTGYSTDEISKIPLENHVVPESLHKALPILKQIRTATKRKRISKEKSWILELELICKDGSRKWTESRIITLRSPEGKMIGFLGTTRDTTDRKRIEEALRINEERFRLLTEATEEGVAIHDRGVILDANNSFCRMFGYDLPEIIGKSAERLATPESWKVILQKIASGDDQPYEGIGVRKDGSTFNCSLVGKPFRYQGKTLRVSTFRDITAQKKAEETLRESEEKFRGLAEESPNMIFINQMGRIVYVNKKCEEVMGYSKQEYYDPNFDFTCLIAPEYRRKILKSYKKHKVGKELEAYEYELLTKRGKQINAIISTKLITYGNKRAILGIVTDITETRKAESKIRLLSTVVEQSTEGIGVCDFEGVLIYVNDAFAVTHGFTPVELIGKPISIFHSPEQMPSVLEANRKLLLTGSFNGEIWHKKRDGSIFPTLMHNTALRDQSGKIIGMIGTLRDITDRKRIEEALKESESKFRSLSENIADSVIIAVNGKNYWVNKATTEIFGYSKKEIVGKGIGFLAVPEEVPKLVQLHKERLAGKDVPIHYETIARRKDGKKIFIDVKARTIVFDNLKAVLLVIRDVTSRKQAEKQLQRYNESLEQMVLERTKRIHELEKQRIEDEKLAATGRMAARIAHEINNPLAGIKNSFLLVKDAISEEHDYFPYVERIEREIERIVRIVRQMFYLYKPDQDAARKFSVQETVYDILTLLEPISKEYQVTLQTKFRGEPPVINASENLFRQILFNIVVNAIEASPQRSTVEIATTIKKKSLIITVSDQGYGIPENLRSKIFEPFFSTKSHLSKTGLGLGLSVTKSLLEAVGGKIDYTSKPEKGTIFRINLPINTQK